MVFGKRDYDLLLIFDFELIFYVLNFSFEFIFKTKRKNQKPILKPSFMYKRQRRLVLVVDFGLVGFENGSILHFYMRRGGIGHGE
ncbi:hypothetical protein bcgnr5379_59880 [Bacillus cereus]